MSEKAKTVKVRIAVAVDPSGKWNASGWNGALGLEAMELAVDCVGPGEARYFVEAELPILEPPVVQGKVEQCHT